MVELYRNLGVIGGFIAFVCFLFVIFCGLVLLINGWRMTYKRRRANRNIDLALKQWTKELMESKKEAFDNENY